MMNLKRISGLVLMLFLCLAANHSFAADGRSVVNINPVWKFWLGEPQGEAFQPGYDDKAWDVVSLPHTLEIFPADLKGFPEHGRNLGWYRRTLNVPAEWLKNKVFLEFRAAMQTTKLWVNGKPAGEYAVSGYDTFHFDITPLLKEGANNLTVRVDDTINPNIPPDGRKTDFMQFGGLYRDVNVVVTGKTHLTFPWEAKQAGIRLTLPNVSEKSAVVQAESTVRNETAAPAEVTLLTEIRDKENKVVETMTDKQTIPANGEFTFTQKSKAIANPHLWSPSDPYLYKTHTIVQTAGAETDRVQTNLGIRWFKFDKKNGFFLNGQHLKLIGANRHQTWPFIGNAVSAGLHRRDAEQLKETGLNWVRLSHYPHDPVFLDILDEVGLLALEEGPTWMGAGNMTWMDNLEKAFRSMIRRDRNHPSIVIWNSCINHGGGNSRLVAASGEEDPTRPRGQSDVGCPMDFGHLKVTGGGALTIEHTGHTYPTTRGQIQQINPAKNIVTESRDFDLAKRHWEHINASYLKEDNSGMAVWCMYDYNTFHGSIDGIARHGVFDLFRIPKYSYYWHKSELTAAPMAYVVRTAPTTAAVFSNCEQVRLSESDGGPFKEIAVQKPDAGFVLKHPAFSFTVSAGATALKAEGLISGKTAASYEWKKAGAPAALTLTADRPNIIADGADCNRLVVTAVDANGTLVDSCEAPVEFKISGMGQLVGENPVKLRAGQFIILAQSAFAPGEITVSVSSNGLRPAEAKFTTLPVAPGVDMPKDLAVKQPTRSKRVVIPKQPSVTSSAPLLFLKPKTGPAGAWVESDIIMIPNEIKEAPITIKDGEYKIYTGEWTSKPGKVITGDAVYIRVKAPDASGKKSRAKITIGNESGNFDVELQRGK